MSEFVLYQKFTLREEALELGDMLKQKGIPYQLETGASGFDPSFVFKDEFRILLHPNDFDRVSALFTENVEADYYLFNFSEGELMEIIEKRDEWSHFDFILAQKILKEKGKNIQPELIEAFENERIIELQKPEKSNSGWIYAGYVFALFGGLIGLFIGWSLLSTKKTMPNGEKVFAYSESDRSHGMRIVVISSVCIPILFGAKVLLNIWEQMR